MTAIGNDCLKCGAEIVGRDAVARLVSGEQRMYVSEGQMRWRSYSCGESFAAGSYGSQLLNFGRYGSKYVDVAAMDRFVRCKCAFFGDVRSVDEIIVKEYREFVHDKFGGHLTMPLLFALPVEMLAWENSDIVRVHPETNMLVVDESCQSVLQHVRKCSLRGGFAGNRVREMEVKAVLEGYTYLYLIQPKYRSYVASDFGAQAAVAELFRSVPLDWFDWFGMLSLYGEVTAKGYEVRRTFGVPVISYLRAMFMNDEEFKPKPVVHGSQISTLSTHVQFLPCDTDIDLDLSTSEIPHIVLSTGVSFLPRGRVVLQADYLAISVEPGVSVRTSSGTIIRGDMGIVIYINGSIDLTFILSDDLGDDTHCSYDRQPSASFEYSVAVVVESYGNYTDTHGRRRETDLAKWHNRRLDVVSTQARFVACGAEFVLFGDIYDDLWLADAIKLSPVRDKDERLFKQSASLDGVEVGLSYGLGTASCILSNASSSDYQYVPVVNGTVRMASDSVVAVVGSARVGIGLRFQSHIIEFVSGSVGSIAKLTFDMSTEGDPYMLDGGGPSGSDGEFMDETGTCAGRGSVIGWLKSRQQLGELSPYDWSFANLFVDTDTAIHAVGLYGMLDQLLTVPAFCVDRDKLYTTGLHIDRGRVTLVDASSSNSSWIDVAKAFVTWRDKASRQYITTLGWLLVDMLLGGEPSNSVCQNLFVE